MKISERLGAENAPTWDKAMFVMRRWSRFDPSVRKPESEMEDLGNDVINYIAGCLTKPGKHPNSGYPIMGEIALGRGSLVGKTVLEAACGFGELSAHLADRGARVIGVDIDPRMIDAAKSAFGNRKNLTFIHGDAADLNEVLRNRRFDFAISQDSTHHLLDVDRLKRFLWNLAGRSDTVIIKDFNRAKAKEGSALWRLLLTNPSTVRLLADSLEAAFTPEEVREAINGLPNAQVKTPVPDMKRLGSPELKKLISQDPVPRHLDESFSWITKIRK